MRPENELEREPRNEVDQQFLFHNMDRNMKAAHRDAMRPVSAESLCTAKREYLAGVLFVFLIVLGGVLAIAFGLI